MKYYQFHVGDYARSTRHLTWDEDLAYRRLLDAYYSADGPLPDDINQICRLILATTEEQRKAVEAVLNEFFTPTESGWAQNRCEREISRTQEKQTRGEKKSSGDLERKRRHRAKRAEMFNELRKFGISLAWNATTKELETLINEARLTQENTPEPGTKTPSPGTHLERTWNVPGDAPGTSQVKNWNAPKAALLQGNTEQGRTWNVLGDAPGTAIPLTINQYPITNNKKYNAPGTSPGTSPGTPRVARPSDVDEDVWRDFLAIRKAKRAPLTPKALEGIQRETQKAGIALNDALQTCIERGWQGFSADWITRKSTRIQPENFASIDYGVSGDI